MIFLASGLGKLSTVKILEPTEIKDPNQAFKLVVFVPEKDISKLQQNLSKIGIGTINNYSNCSFQIEGNGTFLGNEDSNPVVGKKGVTENVKEIRFETVCGKQHLSQIPSIIKQSHSYEEPAWDIYPLQGVPSTTSGQGRLVTLEEKITAQDLFALIKKTSRTREI